MNPLLDATLAFAALALACRFLFFFLSFSIDDAAALAKREQAGRRTTLLVEPLRTIRLVIDNWTDVVSAVGQALSSRRHAHSPNYSIRKSAAPKNTKRPDGYFPPCRLLS